jgi:Putative peptidoglycan binding domain/NlpC/P60 family
MAEIKLKDLMRLALAQVDDKYVFAVEVSRNDPDPESFDCSEIIEWCFERLGVSDFPDGSPNQRAHAQKIPISQAIKTRGAMLGRAPGVLGPGTPGHIAISLGNGKTIEARGSAFGVGIFTADPASRLWTDGGLFPEIDYTGARNRKPLLENGDVGPWVERLQSRLAKHGGDIGSAGVDGEFGDDTEKALRAFQKEKGLKISGECDRVTWKALGEPADPADEEDLVERWVVFGRKGGRYGWAKDLDNLMPKIKEAEEHSGAAVVINRLEPRDFEEEGESYPLWVARKTKEAKP